MTESNADAESDAAPKNDFPTVPTADGDMGIYEVPPAEGEAKGGVVVIQEVFGVNHHIQSVTRRFAEAGYHAIAPEIFHRSGGGTAPYTDFSKVFPLFEGITGDDSMLMDIDASIEQLGKAGIPPERVAVVGFCFGGRIAFLAAVRRQLGAAAGFYGGGIVNERPGPFPALIGEAGDLKTPFLGLFGDHDESIPVPDVETLRTTLDAETKVDHEIVRYADAGHGFHCDARPDHYHEASAQDAWRRTLAWFDTHLGSGSGS
ncbi:MAG: carboxymethylenebutenolidase [Actinomycetota bacterium]|jgi:carboxymethylenebutenolidase|nr:carboxymethylenebutenolidase [Actinomycetota bacterium]